MGEVVQFSESYRRRPKSAPRCDDKPCIIIVLPVIRIEEEEQQKTG